jgi:hypothetical protein
MGSKLNHLYRSRAGSRASLSLSLYIMGSVHIKTTSCQSRMVCRILSAQLSGRPQDTVSSTCHVYFIRGLTRIAFNVGCYTLSVAGQVLHYRTWLFHNVESHTVLSRVMNLSGIIQLIFRILCIICVCAKCTPVEGNWNPTVEAKCWNESVFLGINYSSSAITFVSYMIQGWIPIQMALGLGKRSITRNQWIALSIIAFWNIIAGVLALVKLSYLGLYVVMEDASRYLWSSSRSPGEY